MDISKANFVNDHKSSRWVAKLWRKKFLTFKLEDRHTVILTWVAWGRMVKQQCWNDWVLHWPEPKFLSLSFGPGANTGATALVILTIRVIARVINCSSLHSMLRMIEMPSDATACQDCKVAFRPLLPNSQWLKHLMVPAQISSCCLVH